MTGTGFITEFDRPTTEISSSHQFDLKMGDVLADIPGLMHGAGFLLYVQNGLLDALEGYSFEEPWPSQIKVSNCDLSTRLMPRPRLP